MPFQAVRRTVCPCADPNNLGQADVAGDGHRRLAVIQFADDHPARRGDFRVKAVGEVVGIFGRGRYATAGQQSQRHKKGDGFHSGERGRNRVRRQDLHAHPDCQSALQLTASRRYGGSAGRFAQKNPSVGGRLRPKSELIRRAESARAKHESKNHHHAEESRR